MPKRPFIDDEPKPEDDQFTLLGSDEDFQRAKQVWKGMPEFRQDDLEPLYRITVNFATLDALKKFAETIGQKINPESSRSIWFPELNIASYWDKRYISYKERPK